MSTRKNKRKKNKITIDDIYSPDVEEYQDMYNRAHAKHIKRTKGHDLYAKISHMENLYDEEEVLISEGSTQALKRKVISQTLQRVPDGELLTQFDKNDIRHVETEFIFKNKVLTSEFTGRDMFKNLVRTFKASYDYGFGCVRTGFEKDMYGDIRISYKQIPYNEVMPNPDCDYIEEAEWYVVEESLALAELEGLFTEDDKLIDNSWNEDAVRYIIQHFATDGDNRETLKNKLQDNEKGVGKTESLRVRTIYRRGDKEFVTYSDKFNCILRTVKNYDPRLDVPLHFLILEPDPEYALGASLIQFTMGQQQFADAFQSSTYNNLLLSVNPPLMGFGDFTPEDIYMEPGAYWDLGTNPNNKIEKFTIETTTVTQYGSILEQVASSMSRNLNVSDQTVASDAHVPGWSKTPQGVEQQQMDKTITINQLQKRVEIFFAEWANHALRSYLASMSGTKELTVDEETRRKIWDIEGVDQDPMAENVDSIVVGDKVSINFDDLSYDMLEFQVRTGSLIQSRQDKQRENIQEMLVPVSQMIGALSEENRPAFEQSIMQMVQRLLELSDVDFSAQAGKRIDDKLVIDSLKAAYAQIIDQNKAIEQLQQLAIQGLPQGGEQPQQQEQGQTQSGGAMPMPEEAMPQQQQQAQPQQAQQEPQMEEGSAQLPPEIMQQLMAQKQKQSQQETQAQVEQQMAAKQAAQGEQGAEEEAAMT